MFGISDLGISIPDLARSIMGKLIPTFKPSNKGPLMGNIYYKIWVDAIVWEKATNGKRRNWKGFTLIPISLCEGINLLTICFWCHIPIFIDINFFSIKPLNSSLSFSISLLFPFLILNYFLIIYHDRYESLIERYKYHNGKLYLWYFLLSIGAFIVPIIIGAILGKV